MKEKSGERSAACATCGKTFARSDTLLRHEKSHHATEDRGPIHRVTNGTFRACSNCAQARSRCSGGNPCGRCKMRSLECYYPNKRRKGPQFENQIMFDQELSPRQNQITTNEINMPSQNNQGQFHNVIFAQQPQSTFPAGSQMSNIKPEAEGQTNMIMPEAASTSYNVNQAQNMGGLQQGSMTMHTGSDIQTQHEQFSTAVPSQFHPQFHESIPDFAFDSAYDESLNWIPLSIYPSPYGDFEGDISFLLPTLSDTASLSNEFTAGQYDVAPPTTITSDPNTNRPVSDLSNSMPGFTHSPASSAGDSLGTFKAIGNDNTLADMRRKRRKSSFAADVFTRPRNTTRAFTFPDVSELGIGITTYGHCSEAIYRSIITAFQKTCTGSNLNRFSGDNFPDIASLNICVELYLTNFHKSFPILHVTSLGTESHWLITLAAAAIGSCFAKVPDVVSLREAFQEFLRRALHYVSEIEIEDLPLIHLGQAKLLNLIGLTQSDRDQLRLMAPKYHAELSRWCLEAGLLQIIDQDVPIPADATEEEKRTLWRDWIRLETQRRVGYFTWLLDISVGYLCNARPLCNMDDARAPLPCHDSLWNASTPADWIIHKSRLQFSNTPSLCEALEVLYNKKNIDTSISETSHLLLIHALISRTYEVGTHIKQPLSEWKPTGNAKGFLNTPAKDNFWLPLYPLYANWRNSACDCLDVLHWHATSIVAKASGAEHDVILYLHLARIVLLTPFQEIQDLLFYIIGHRVGPNAKASYYVHDGSYQSRTKAKAAQIKKITWRWLREDQHKARLAIIHAGSVFWHVRRYSSNNFYEPTAVYLATIVLWVYGSFKSTALGKEAAASVEDVGPKKPNEGPAELMKGNVQPTRLETEGRAYSTPRSRRDHQDEPLDTIGTEFSPRHSRSGTNGQPSLDNAQNNGNSAEPVESADVSESESSSDQPEFIYLDRPVDDEMVQHFVRSGHNMCSYMSNVNDICKNPTKILHEGAKLLKSRLATWGVSREYYDILMRLSEMRKNSSGAIVPITPYHVVSTPAAHT